MKTRSDYVSNSSSSSFIIHLDKPIDEYSKEEFMEKFETYRALDILFEKLYTEYILSNEKDLTFDVDYSDNPVITRVLDIERDLNNDIVEKEML